MKIKTKNKIDIFTIIFLSILILTFILVSYNKINYIETKEKSNLLIGENISLKKEKNIKAGEEMNLSTKNDIINLKKDIKKISIESNALNLKISYEEMDSVYYETNYEKIDINSEINEKDLIISIKTVFTGKTDEYFTLKIPKKYKNDFLVNIDSLNLNGLLENDFNEILSSSANININCKDNSNLKINCENGNVTLGFNNFNEGNNNIDLVNGTFKIDYKNIPDSIFEVSVKEGIVLSNFLDVTTFPTETIKTSSLNGNANTKINLCSGIVEINKK